MHLTKYKPTLKNSDPVLVLDLQDEWPDSIEKIGEIKIDNEVINGENPQEAIMQRLIQATRRAGGNVVKLTHLKSYHRFWKQRCDVKAHIGYHYKVASCLSHHGDIIDCEEDYATLYGFRYKEDHFLTNYDFHIGDSMDCRVKYNTKTSVRIKTGGRKYVWISGVANIEGPIDVELGQNYDLNRNTEMGIFSPSPTISLVDKEVREIEYKTFNTKMP